MNKIPLMLKYRNKGDGWNSCLICAMKSGLKPYREIAIENKIMVSNAPPATICLLSPSFCGEK